ncbi:MAG: DUF402 domain-containing protein, partial [Nocardia sp.]|nr:DUF402 domain-containing protein [Nocardia sp.]
MTQGHTVDLHRPKVEYFDLAASTNTDPKGFVRPVETYRLESSGLYMARTADHREFHYLESWLLPEVSLRASIFHFNPGYERDQDLYLDIGDFGPDRPDVWKSQDHYLDVILRAGRDAV